MKRIIAVMVALMFAAVLFNINVSAADNSAYDTQMELKRQFQTDYLNLVGEYENGYITYDEFKARADEITERYNEVNTDENGVLNDIAKKTTETVNSVTEGIGNAIGTVGESVKDWISDVFNGNESTETVSSTDMQGYGCMVTYYGTDTYSIFYGDYVVLHNNEKGSFVIYSDGEIDCKRVRKGSSGEITEAYSSTFSLNNSSVYNFYGDIRNKDGTQAPTNDEYIEKPTYDFSDNTDSELDELLNELLEELNRQAPDLSSVEGLLESIYYRLGRLDSDNDNALLSDINTAILSLSASNDESTAEVISALAEVREAIKNMSTDMDNNFDDLQDDFNKIADFEVPTELFIIDSDSLSDEVKNKVDDIVELITTLVAKGVPMAAINGGLLVYQDIIFNSHEPQDIIFNLTFNGEEYSFTLLSTSFFGSEGAQALQIIKNFVAIVLGYAWVLAMRKKAASMMN